MQFKNHTSQAWKRARPRTHRSLVTELSSAGLARPGTERGVQASLGRTMGSSFSKEVKDCCNSRNGRSAGARTPRCLLARK